MCEAPAETMLGPG